MERNTLSLLSGNTYPGTGFIILNCTALLWMLSRRSLAHNLSFCQLPSLKNSVYKEPRQTCSPVLPISYLFWAASPFYRHTSHAGLSHWVRTKPFLLYKDFSPSKDLIYCLKLWHFVVPYTIMSHSLISWTVTGSFLAVKKPSTITSAHMLNILWLP